jgi:hypothetical protein
MKVRAHCAQDKVKHFAQYDKNAALTNFAHADVVEQTKTLIKQRSLRTAIA